MEIDRCDVESLIERSCRLQFERPLSREIPRDRLVKIFAYAEESSSERPRRCHRRVIRSNILIISDRHATRQPSVNETRVVADIDPTPIDVSRPVLPLHAHQFTSSTKITKAIEDAARHYLYLYDSSPVDPSITNRMRMCFFFPLLFLFPFSFSSSFFSAKSWWDASLTHAGSLTRKQEGKEEKEESGRVMNGKYV